MNYWRLWQDLPRFRRRGLLGLIDRRTLLLTQGDEGGRNGEAVTSPLDALR
jgi:hypothetical protein